ncbi:MAG: hypothetical protein V7638_3834 [Acidobacteriota bacterium]|jgi:hypothetical protein
MATVAKEQNKKFPNFRIKAYIDQLPAMKICQDAYAGTLRFRHCEVEYLPKNPQEPKDEYELRVQKSVALPAVKRAITLALGLVFDKDPTVKDVDKQIEQELKNIDLAGKSVGLFAREALKTALRDGHSFIYVDMPKSVTETLTQSEETNASEPTYLDEQKLRPYWVLYQKAQVVNWKFENVYGHQVLKRVSLRECQQEEDGDFGEKTVVRYRVLTPGMITMWREKADGTCELEGRSNSSLPYIPLFPIYGGEELDPFVSEPALLDLALMVVQHLQMTSDLHGILHVANVPILWARDRDQKKKFESVGPSVLIDLKGEHSELGYAEHQGHAIGKAQDEIKQLEQRMAVAGFKLLVPQTSGPRTATGEIKDTVESDSELSLAVKSLTNALKLALIAHGDYRGKDELGTIELNVQYDRLHLDSQDIDTLRNLANDHHLSTYTLLMLLKTAGKLGPDFDIDAEMVRIFGPDCDKPDVVREAENDPSRQEPPNTNLPPKQ